MGKIFALELSSWEEGIAAAAFLEGWIGDRQAFRGGEAGRITAVLAGLICLPWHWARELCFEALSTPSAGEAKGLCALNPGAEV